MYIDQIVLSMHSDYPSRADVLLCVKDYEPDEKVADYGAFVAE